MLRRLLRSSHIWTRGFSSAAPSPPPPPPPPPSFKSVPKAPARPKANNAQGSAKEEATQTKRPVRRNQGNASKFSQQGRQLRSKSAQASGNNNSGVARQRKRERGSNNRNALLMHSRLTKSQRASASLDGDISRNVIVEPHIRVTRFSDMFTKALNRASESRLEDALTKLDILDKERVILYYLRLEQFQFPQLKAFQEPFVPPAKTAIVKCRRTHHMGKSNADNSASKIELNPDLLPGLTREQIRKFKLLAGPRWDAFKGTVGIGSRKFPSYEMNLKWCQDVLDELIRVSKDKDTMSDIPLDNRRAESKAQKHRSRHYEVTLDVFPQQWLEHSSSSSVLRPASASASTSTDKLTTNKKVAEHEPPKSEAQSEAVEQQQVATTTRS